MANQDTAEYTKQKEGKYKREVAFDAREFQREVKTAVFSTITLTGDFDAGNDTLSLGKIGVDGIILPELCRMVGTSGSVQGTFSIQKVVGGSATALTGLATLATDETSVPFARKAGAASGAAFGADDLLQLKIGTATALSAGDTVELYIVYATKGGI